MARIRTIKPEFPQSESMGRVSRESRLCFILLWTLADDSGRLRGNSRMLASLLFPYDDDAPIKIDLWLTELEREDCIARYTANGSVFIQIRNWLSHQKIDKPSASRFPEFDEGSRILANPRECSSGDLGSKDLGSRIEDLGSFCSEPPKPATREPVEASPILLTFPVIGAEDWGLSVAKLDEYRETFPDMDVLAECRKARQWCVDNRPKRKTPRGMPNFLRGWLERAQNAGKAATNGIHRSGTGAATGQSAEQLRRQNSLDVLAAFGRGEIGPGSICEGDGAPLRIQADQ